MAKTKVTTNAKTAKNYKVKTVRTPGTKMSARQQYKVELARQKNVALKTNKAAANIRAAGEALAQVTTPYAIQRSTTTVTQEKEATKRAANQQAALDTWKSIMGGNPSSDTGTEGSSQSNSVGNAGGGSILGG